MMSTRDGVTVLGCQECGEAVWAKERFFGGGAITAGVGRRVKSKEEIDTEINRLLGVQR